MMNPIVLLHLFVITSLMLELCDEEAVKSLNYILCPSLGS